MNRKKQAGKSAKGSSQKKVDWKTLEIVHPDAAGGTAYYEARYREQQIRSLTKRAQKLGLQVVIPQAA